MIKLLILDWDGTLVDSVNKILQCKRCLARVYNFPEPTEETVRNVLGTKFENALKNCSPSASQAILSNIKNDFHLLMQQDEYQAPLFPDAREMLQAIKLMDVKLAVATSKNREELNKAIKYHLLTDLFEITCCSKEHQEKPHPAMIEYILNSLSIKKNECLMLGDTTTDIEFARNAGIRIACVTFGAHSPEKLQLMNPLTFATSWLQLPGIVQMGSV